MKTHKTTIQKQTLLVLSILLFLCCSFISVQAMGAGTDPFQLPDTSEHQVPEVTDAQTAVAPAAENTPVYLNPLTGLQVADVNSLYIPPIMVSVNNPYYKGEATYGLSMADFTFELYTGDGESRFMPVFYANTIPEYSQIGPVRTSRFSFETIKSHFGGILINESSADEKDQAAYNNTFNVPASSSQNTNSAFTSPAQMTSFAENSAARMVFEPGKLYTYAFSDDIPLNGTYAPYLWFMYNKLNNAIWWFSDQGTYVRSQFLSGAGNRMVMMEDSLTNSPIAYENIILLMADHRVCKDNKYDLDMENKFGSATFFRDGMMFSGRWVTQNPGVQVMPGQLSSIHFTDMAGNPFPLKPGRTWVYILPTSPKIAEREMSVEVQNLISGSGTLVPDQLYRKFTKTQYGTGLWGVKQYMSTDGPRDNEICSRQGK